MQSTLVDSGPLIALFDRDDRHHRRVAAFLESQRLRLVTTWPVLTEVSALLPRAAALDFVEYVGRGGVAVENLGQDDLRMMLSLGRKYSDVPMDFADASLVALAMRAGIHTILSLDRDFEIYRLAHKRSFRNLLSSTRR
ncbi:MAG: type II toxin-antitoxin system VapC family toxin [Burkholderiales bacterium]